MSLQDRADEAWEERASDPQDAYKAFVAGYLAACKDIGEQITEGNLSEPYGFNGRAIRYPRPQADTDTRVYIDRSLLQEINIHLERDPNDFT